MKRFLLIISFILTLPTFAQENYQYRISSLMSPDATYILTYNYSEPTGNDLRGIHETDLAEDPVWELIDSLHYDSEGRIIQIATHQNFDGQWRKVCWIDYTYNEKGLRETRKNYNDLNDGWGPQLGGTYYYSYDDNDRMVSWILEFDGYDFKKAELTYNEDGLLVKETVWQDSFTGTWDNSDLTEYFYNDDNYVEQVNVSVGNYNTWALFAVQFNTYDEAGNCVEVMTISPDGIPQEKRVYVYDEKVLNENVFHFSNPENDFPTLPQMHNMLTSYESWGVSQATGELVYLGDYLFEYEQIGEIELNVTANASAEIVEAGTPFTLNAYANGGTGEYEYTWSPAEYLNDANSQNPTATIAEEGSYTFTVVVNDGTSTAEANVTVEVINSIGIDENILSKTNIYPNPAKDFITINSGIVEYVEIFDIYGRLIASTEIKGETTIEMNDLAEGIYYVKLHSNGATAVQKIVIE